MQRCSGSCFDTSTSTTRVRGVHRQLRHLPLPRDLELSSDWWGGRTGCFGALVSRWGGSRQASSTTDPLARWPE